ncbi:MAG: hypothetical protein ABI852_17165 [Gemmatimonadaceae bacterium]
MKLNARISRVVFAGCIFLPALIIDAQTAVPVRTLSAPEAVTLLPFGAIESVRPLNKGGVLVNDSHKRQLIALDSTFASFSVTLDSVPEKALYYNSKSISLIPYTGDSTLYQDVRQQKFFVIDPNGEVVSAFGKQLAGSDLLNIFPPRGFDAAGNAITMGIPQFNLFPNGGAAGNSERQIVRVNFTTQKYEELTNIMTMPLESVRSSLDSKGQQHAVRTVNPMASSDEWVVLMDGAVAVLRAKDYRVEMFGANGKKVASVKLPYTKRRVSDAEKRAIIDSARKAINDEPVSLTSPTNTMLATIGELQKIGPDSLKKIARKEDGAFKVSGTATAVVQAEIVFSPLSEMENFYPPFRKGQPSADLDGNLWIATTAISPIDANETIYDVVNNRGVLTQRVRVPAGRSIVGFGRGGAIYLKFRKNENAWMLERVRTVN